MTLPPRSRRTRTIVLLLAAAVALDLALLRLAAGSGASLKLGTSRLRIHDTYTPIAFAAAIVAVIVGLGWRDDRRRGLALASVVAVGAAASSILARSAQPAFPLSDIAVIEIYTREALSGRLLVGPYSRFGWHHPGPMYFYLAAPVYALGGATTAAMTAAALVLSLAAAAIIAWTAARSAGAVVSSALLAATTMCVYRLNALIDSVWNPHVIVLPAVALLVVCAALSCGDFVMLPLAAVLASFVMQTDVALVPFAGAMMSLSLVAGAATIARRPWRRRPIETGLSVTAWLMVIAWFLPLAEQVSRNPGNLTALWQFFVARPGSGQPFSTAMAIWAGMMTAALRPEFTLARGATILPEISPSQVALAVTQVVCPLIAAIWAFRARLRGLARLAMLSAVGSIVALWSTTRIEGPAHDHEMFWLAIVGASNVAIVVAALVMWLQRRLGERAWLTRFGAPVAHAALIGALLMIGLQQVDRARQGSFPVTLTSSTVPVFVASIREYLQQAGVRRPFFRIDDEQWAVAAGILRELDRSDVQFAIEDSWLPVFTDRFAATGDEDAELTIAAAGARPELAARPGNVTVDVSSQVHVEAIKVAPNRNR